MSEYIGSRISLVSKSDIRYVGVLHEINSENHTVALEQVTSFGTEDRKPPAETIPGSDQVYEYIVFRGSDVKELNIVAPPTAPKENEQPQVPNDPAILGSARPPPPQQPPSQFQGGQTPYPPPPQQFGGYPQGPPPNQFQGQPRFQGHAGPHGFPGSPGAVPGYGMGYGPPPGYYGPPPGQGFPQHPPQGQFPPQQQMPTGQAPPVNQQRPPPPGQQQPPAGSKQGTPQPGQQPGPPPPGFGGQQKPAEMSTTPAPGSAGPPPPVDSKPPPPGANAPAGAPAQRGVLPKPPQSKPNTSRVAIPNMAAKPAQRPSATQQGPPPSTQPPSIQDATQAATAAVAAAMAKLGPVNAQGPTSGMDNLSEKVNQMRMHDPQQRGRGRGRGGARGGRRESIQRNIEVPKEDFDFETANAKFNKQDLVKEAIASGSPAGTPVNGATPDPIANLNGHADGDAEDVVIPSKPNGDKGYDKKSSFFDNISSDLKDRVQQQSTEQGFDGRAMRREERTKNVETFGQGSVDTGYRGGFRGRGRGRGFGRGGRGFGGPRGGFEGRGGGDFRGRGRGGAEAPAAV